MSLKRIIKPVITFLSLSLVVLLIVAPKAHATSVQSYLTTTPPSKNITIKPGQSGSVQLEVQNDASVPQTITVKLDKFSASGNLGKASILPPEATDPSVAWVHFSQTSFLAQPGVWNTITMTINVPTYASFGYYYAVIFSPSNPQTVTSGYGYQGGNVVFVLLDTNSTNERKQISLTSFSSTSGLYQFLPAIFNVVVKNSGNIHLIPGGDIIISRTPNGKQLAALPINVGLGNVLPDSSRQFSASWTDGLPSFEPIEVNGQPINNKNGQPTQVLRWNFSDPISKFRFGKYYAHLILVYNDGTRDIPINAYLSFWVIPWKLILIIIFVIAAIILFWKTIKKAVKQLWNISITRNKRN